MFIMYVSIHYVTFSRQYSQFYVQVNEKFFKLQSGDIGMV